MSKKKPLPPCPYCGERANLFFPDGTRMSCPRCGREGCEECLPGGRGIICPECESLDDHDDRNIVTGEREP